jgi:hypothetical protein
VDYKAAQEANVAAPEPVEAPCYQNIFLSWFYGTVCEIPPPAEEAVAPEATAEEEEVAEDVADDSQDAAATADAAEAAGTDGDDGTAAGDVATADVGDDSAGAVQGGDAAAIAGVADDGGLDETLGESIEEAPAGGTEVSSDTADDTDGKK